MIVAVGLMAYLQSMASVAGHRAAGELTYAVTGRLRVYVFNAEELKALAIYSALARGVN